MTTTRPSAPWRQMIFVSPEGRQEALWVEPVTGGAYRVLSPPVWMYGISMGSLVRASEGPNGLLAFEELVTPSEGGTVRVVVAPEGLPASELYLTRLVPAAQARGLSIGPATFFNPRLVVINVRKRAQWWPEVGELLDSLVRDGTIEQWEVADPDAYAAEGRNAQSEPVGEILMHQLPVVEERGSSNN